ncbi:MAG: VWA domain-containing protein [Bacteroidota bacterium]|nr:VWA domain-containing protein [Bacteroidota bacterium]
MKKLISIALLFVIIAVSGCYMTKKSTDYYGVELKEKRFVFLVDISGSMENKIEKNAKGIVVSKATNIVANQVEDKIGGEIGGLVSKKIKKSLTKLEKAKKKIIPVINGFTDEHYFTIILFENDIKLWKNGMVQATGFNKKSGVAHVKALKSGGGTNISDALEMAFDLAGDGTSDPSKSLNVETIFLLTDGEPTAGKYTNPDDILEKVSVWNPNRRVTVHAIGLGDNHDKEFMRKIAEQNNGVYIDK